jgi:curli biogenesis system outer membrane secretion channel CsgG
MSLSKSGVCWFLATVAVATLAGCATTIYIPVKVMHPAEINMTPYKQIVIGEIHGNMAQGFSDGVKESLVQSGHFTVVDRAQLSQILGEQSLSQSDLADPKSRLRIGKLLAASALITGHTEGEFKTEVTYQDSTCQRYLGKGPNGKDVWQPYACKVYTRTGKSVTSGSIDVIDVTTGQIVKSKQLGGGCSNQTQATDATPANIDSRETLACAQGQNISTFVKSISPWSQTVMAPFAKDSSIPDLEIGIRHGRRPDLRRNSEA